MKYNYFVNNYKCSQTFFIHELCVCIAGNYIDTNKAYDYIKRSRKQIRVAQQIIKRDGVNGASFKGRHPILDDMIFEITKAE